MAININTYQKPLTIDRKYKVFFFLFLAFALCAATKANKRLTRAASHKSDRLKSAK